MSAVASHETAASPHARLPSARARRGGDHRRAVGRRRELNRRRLLPRAVTHLETAGNLDNLRSPPGREPSRSAARCSWTPTSTSGSRRPRGSRAPAEPTGAAGRPQRGDRRSSPPPRSDGRLHRLATCSSRPAGERYRDLAQDHEHYCAGHLIQAAVAHVRVHRRRAPAGGRRRFADHLVATFGPDRPGRRRRPPRDRDGAGRAVPRDRRRRATSTSPSTSSTARPRAARPRHGTGRLLPGPRAGARGDEVEGHAVRAVYLAAGRRRRRPRDRRRGAARRRWSAQWREWSRRKTYVTGGLGVALGRRGVRRPVRAAHGPGATPRRARPSRGVKWAGGCCWPPARRATPTCSSGRCTTASSPGVSLDGGGVLLRQPAARARRRAATRPSAARGRRSLVRRGVLPAEHDAAAGQPRALPRDHASHGVQVHQYAAGQDRERAPEGGPVRLRGDRVPVGGTVPCA